MKCNSVRTSYARVLLCIFCMVAVAFAFNADPIFAASSFSKTKVKGVKVKVVENNTAGVSWNRTSGASGYVVYCSDKKNKGYKRVVTAGKAVTTAEISKLKIGKTYYFKIRAYKKQGNKRIYSKYSKKVKLLVKVAPPKATVMAVNETTSKMKISFTRSTGSKGYEIWRASKKDGKYTRIKVLSAKTTSFTNTGLKANTWYYYKVRAYALNKKKKIYGGFSAVAADTTGGNSTQFDLSKVTATGGKLKGKKIMFLGSSITYGSGSGGVSFVDYLAKKDGIIAEKRTVPGTTISTAKSNSYVERIKKVSYDPSRKLVVCQLSTNDSKFKIRAKTEDGDEESSEGKYIALSAGDDEGGEGDGQDPPGGDDPDPSGGDDPDPSGGDDPQEPAFDDLTELEKHTDTVKGAIDYITVYSNQKLKCPVVFYVIPPFTTTQTFDSTFYSQMRNALFESKNYWSGHGYSVYVMDMHNTKAYPTFSGFATFNEKRAFYMRDAVHPTKAGYYKKFLPVFENYLTNQVKW